ncbi:hypothetical protein ACFPK5_28510 [Streptomyces beijiangensis]
MPVSALPPLPPGALLLAGPTPSALEVALRRAVRLGMAGPPLMP